MPPPAPAEVGKYRRSRDVGTEVPTHGGSLVRVVHSGWTRTQRTRKQVQEMLDAIPQPVLTPRVVTDRGNSVVAEGSA